MSVVIAIKFLAGRFHATPWDRQVNEGVVEWPPSPWRIMRSLVSAYYRLPVTPDRSDLSELLAQLSESLPSYVLPRTSSAHTRHYMPVWKEGEEKTAKVFDTFVVLDKEAELIVAWLDVELGEKGVALLECLCRQVSYLGRAESWAELTVRDTAPVCYNAIPIGENERSPLLWEKVKVLAALTPEGLQGFRAGLAAIAPLKGKKKWQIPTDVLSALELDIGDLHAGGWSGIPGARWVTYLLEKPILEVRSPLSVSYQGLSPNFARYALVSNVLPNLTEALSVGDRFRVALMSLSKDGNNQPDAVFSGRDAEGNYRQDDHQHAWYLPEVNRYGKIESLVVCAGNGFSLDRAVPALQKLRKIWGSSDSDIQVILIALGEAELYRADVEKGEEKGRSLVLGKGRVWQSLTPVVLPRHPKLYRTGELKIDPETGLHIDGPEEQIRKMLKQQKFDAPVKVELIGDGKEVGQYPWQAFSRQRLNGGGSKGPDRGYGFKLQFEQPQHGPMALGYGAHYGLGVFVPVG